jgi:hypothetical protein
MSARADKEEGGGKREDGRAQLPLELDTLLLVVAIVLRPNKHIGRLVLLDPINERKDHIVLSVEDGRLASSACADRLLRVRTEAVEGARGQRWVEKMLERAEDALPCSWAGAAVTHSWRHEQAVRGRKVFEAESAVDFFVVSAPSRRVS